MQEKVVPHAREGQREGFAESMCAACDKSKRLGHREIVNEKTELKGVIHQRKFEVLW